MGTRTWLRQCHQKCHTGSELQWLRFKWGAMVDSQWGVYILEEDSETWIKDVIELTQAEKDRCIVNWRTYTQLWNLAVQEGWNEASSQPMSSAESALDGPSLNRHAARGHD